MGTYVLLFLGRPRRCGASWPMLSSNPWHEPVDYLIACKETNLHGERLHLLGQLQHLH